MKSSPEYKLSKHADQRCAQRSYDDEDIALILDYGTQTSEGVLMRKKDVAVAVNELRSELRKLQQGHLRRAA